MVEVLQSIVALVVTLSILVTFHEFGHYWVARKFIPSVSLKSPPDVDQLTLTTLTNVVVDEVHAGPATLSFGASPADRLADVPIARVTGGWFFQSEMTLEDGQVLHDYLA